MLKKLLFFAILLQNVFKANLSPQEEFLNFQPWVIAEQLNHLHIPEEDINKILKNLQKDLETVRSYIQYSFIIPLYQKDPVNYAKKLGLSLMHLMNGLIKEYRLPVSLFHAFSTTCRVVYNNDSVPVYDIEHMKNPYWLVQEIMSLDYHQFMEKYNSSIEEVFNCIKMLMLFNPEEHKPSAESFLYYFCREFIRANLYTDLCIQGIDKALEESEVQLSSEEIESIEMHLKTIGAMLCVTVKNIETICRTSLNNNIQ